MGLGVPRHAQSPLTLFLTVPVAMNLGAGRGFEAVRFHHRGNRVLVHISFAGVFLKLLRRRGLGWLHCAHSYFLFPTMCAPEWPESRWYPDL